MTFALDLDGELLQRVQLAAKARGVAPEQLIAQAIRTHLQDETARPPIDDLPVAQSLEFCRPDIAGLSLGKILDILEDGFPVSKMR
jgi:hypothetical protein